MGRILFFASLAVQGYFYWHAKSRMTCCADRWMIYMLMVPIIGPLLYFFMVYLPTELPGRQQTKIKRSLQEILLPKVALKQACAAFDASQNFATSSALASVLLQSKQYAEAAEQYRYTLALPADIPARTYMAAAEAVWQCGHADEALCYLHQAAEQTGSPAQKADINMALASIYLDQHQTAAALSSLEGIRSDALGEQVRYLLAQAYLQQGDAQQAMSCLAEIDRRTKNASIVYRSRQSEWIKKARKMARQIEAQTAQAA